jgi:hypothetical protein
MAMTGTSDDDAAEVTTVQFTYRGVAYTVDLDEGGVAEFDTALAPYMAAGRRVGGVRYRPGGTTATATERAPVGEPRGRAQWERDHL